MFPALLAGHAIPLGLRFDFRRVTFYLASNLARRNVNSVAKRASVCDTPKALNLFILLVACSLLLSSSSLSQSVIVWDPEIRLSYDGLFDVVPRVIAVGDTVHVAWHNDSTTAYLRSSDAGATWSAPVGIHRDTLINSISLEYVAAAGPFVHTVWTTCDTCGPATIYWVTFRRSTNAGTSFEPYERLFRGAAKTLSVCDSIIAFVYQTDPHREKDGSQ